jgi:hypothetical protein
LIRGIAKEDALSVDQFAKIMRFDIETAREVFAELSVRGFPTDETGSIVSAFVSTTETPLRLHVFGKDLYVWCALCIPSAGFGLEAALI